MRLLFASALVFLLATSLSAAEKKDILVALEKAKSAFENPGTFKGNAWNEAVDSIHGLLTESSDNVLRDGYAMLVTINKDLVGLLHKSAGKCVPPNEFIKIESGANNARKKLQKPTYVLPSKRATREVLVKLADYIVDAAKIGSFRRQICKNLETLATLEEVQKKLGEVESARKKAHENINAVAQTKENFDKMQHEFVSLAASVNEYIQLVKKELINLKDQKSVKEHSIKTLEKDLAILEAGIKHVKDNSEEAKRKEVTADSIKQTIDAVKHDLEVLAANTKEIESILNDESIVAGREKARAASDKALQESVAAIIRIRMSGEQAVSVVAEYKKAEDLAKTSCGIEQATGRTFKACQVNALSKIREAARGAKLEKQCSLKDNSAQKDIDVCVAAVGI